MDTFAWMDKGCQQVQMPPQSSKSAAWQTDRMRSHQTMTFGTSYQYRTSKTGAHPLQSYQSLSPDWQAWTTFCRQIPAGGRNPDDWSINRNYQSRSLEFMAGDGAQQGFSSNCPQNSSAQGPVNFVRVREATLRPQYTSAANSFPSKQGSYSDTLSSTAHNFNHRPNSTQDRFPSSGLPPDYWSHRNIPANLSSSQKTVSRSQRVQPHQALVSSRGWYDTNSCSTTDRLPLNSSDGTREKMIAKIVEDLRNSYNSGHPAAHSRNQHVSQSQVTGSGFNHHTQQAGNYSHSSHSTPLCSAQSSPKITHSQAAKASKAANANFRDLYRSPVQPSDDASQPEVSSPLLREMLKGTSSGSSVHLSPASVGTRAVAVVQPLLQESCHQDARHNTSPDMTDKPTEHAQMDGLLWRKSQEVRKRANVSPEKSRHITFVKSKTSVSSVSDETLLDSSEALTQNQPTEPEPAADIQDRQHVSPAPQEPAAEVPESQDKDNNVNPAHSPERFVELSLIPTIPHTPGMMRKIIQELNTENADHIRKSSVCSSASILINMFWDGDAKAFSSGVKERLFKIQCEADDFCREHITDDTVIMSGIKEDDWKAVKEHCILKHDEAYTEPPYRPFWLNEKLDDIEKEFGLPWSLRRRPRTLESDIDLDQNDSISEEILREVSESVLALMEQEPVDLGGRESSCSDKTTSIKPAMSTESSDPCCALEIKVLPVEEAFSVFEQAVMSAKAQPEREERKLAEAKLQEEIDVEQEGAGGSPMEQVCCMKKLMVIAHGPNAALSACECPSEKDPPEDSKMCEEEEELKSDELDVLSSDCTSDSMEGGHPAKGGDSYNTETIIFVETVDSLEKNETDSLQEVINSCQPSHTLTIGDMDNGPLGCENRAPELVHADAPEQFTRPIHSSQTETRDLSPAVADGGYCSETEILGLPTCPQTEGLQDDGGSPNRSVEPSVQDALSEKKKRLAEVTESKYLSLKYRTAKLVLFGSSQHARHSTVGRMSHVFASGNKSTTKSGPPEVLSVRLSPLKRKFSEVVPAEEPSVKLRIYEKWRKSLPPSHNRYKKFKSQKSSSLMSPKKSDRTGGLKPPLLSEKRIYDVKVISKRGRLLSNGQKHRKAKRGKRRHAEKPTDQPHDENIILKFSVLPETFSFKDEPHGTESTTAPPVQDTTEHAERKSSIKTDRSEKETWSKHSEKKYCPLDGKTSSVFQEFKNKYKQLLQQEH